MDEPFKSDTTRVLRPETGELSANVSVSMNGALVRLSITRMVPDEEAGVDSLRFAFADLNLDQALKVSAGLSGAIYAMTVSSPATRICHVDEMKDIPEAIYIGRANPSRWLAESKFHNPFPVGKEQHARHWSLQRFRAYLKQDEKFGIVLGDLPRLRGKPLACWCRRSNEPLRLNNECHGDVLLEYLDGYTDEELRAFRRR